MHKLVFRYTRALLAQNLIPSWTNEVQPGDSNKVNPKKCAHPRDTLVCGGT
jgi:hypothetical protein